MRRVALLLATALVLGAVAGFVVRTGTAGDAGPEGAPSPRAEATHVAPLRAQPPPHRGTPRSERARPSLWIPRLHLRSRIFDSSHLSRGPAWWPITGRPGGGDTIAVAGHRTTHSRPFYFLERIQRGDQVHIAYRGQRYVSRVAKSCFVRESASQTPLLRTFAAECMHAAGSAELFVVGASGVAREIPLELGRHGKGLGT
jgi:hypothetical protein